jgi:hypothetical protein
MRADQASGARQDPQPQCYQISVRGRLGQMMRAAFPALQARTRGEDTTLTGTLADQAALYGVLAEIEALGLELLEVRRPPAEAGPWPEEPAADLAGVSGEARPRRRIGRLPAAGHIWDTSP